MAGAPARSSARGAAIGDARRGARRPRFHHCLRAASHPALRVPGCGRPLLPSQRRARPRPRRPGWLPAAPPTSYPRPPRHGALPAGRSLTRRAAPPVSPAVSPRHGPGPRLTMAAARHSTLDFKLGAKGEGARPPPALSLPPPSELGPAGPGGARAAGRTMRTAARPRLRRGRLPGCRVHRRPRGGRAPPPAALGPGGSAGPGGAAPAPSSTRTEPPSGARVVHPRPTRDRPSSWGSPRGRKTPVGGGTGCSPFPILSSLRRVNSPGAGAPLVGAGLGQDRVGLAEFSDNCVGDRFPRKGTGQGKRKR